MGPITDECPAEYSRFWICVVLLYTQDSLARFVEERDLVSNFCSATFGRDTLVNFCKNHLPFLLDEDSITLVGS